MSKTKIPDVLKLEVRALQNNPSTNLAICYLTGKDLEEKDVEYDHVIPEASGGATVTSNIRIIDKTLNKKKGVFSLKDFKERLSIETLFKNKSSIALQDLLDFKKIGRKPIKLSLDEDYAYFGKDCYKLFYCNKTKAKYFFAKIGYEYVSNDTEDGLQPRNIDIRKLLDLKDNFQNRPQLQPSIARLKNDKILLFDGQHKAGANLLNGNSDIELKVYIDDKDDNALFQTLMITNLEAHNKFKQTGFVSSVLTDKMKSIADTHFDEYMATDAPVHSEKGYVDFLITKKNFKKSEAEKIVWSYIFDAQIDAFGLKEYMVDRNSFNTSKKGISQNALKKYFIEKFCCNTLLEEDFSELLRDCENENFNLITSLFLKHAKNESETFRKRFFNVYALETVVNMVRDLMYHTCDIFTEAARKKPLINLEITDEMLIKIQQYVDCIYSHVVWIDESTNHSWRVSGSGPIKAHFEKSGLTINYILTNFK